MSLFSHRNFNLFLLFLIVFLSRIPFLDAGYGVEEDSWGIALEAYNTNMSGEYEPSRLPGHPVQEIPLSALWLMGPVMFNALSAFFSALGALFFALILTQLNFRFYILAAFAFAFIPVYFISSTYTIDFVWTQAFVLISLYLLLNEKLVMCGVFLGLAVGCRITSGAMIIPFMIIVWQQNNFRENFTRFLRISVPMGIVAISSFVPVMQKYGLSFFMYYDQFPYPPLTKVLYKMSIGAFGFIGIVAIGFGLFAAVLNRKYQSAGKLFSRIPDKKVLLASAVVIVLYIISYFRLPQKSGYMMPVLPFLILLFGYYLNARNFKILCFAFIASSFICSINLTDKLRGAAYSKFAATFNISGQEIFFDPISGPLFSDYSKRKQKIRYTNEVIEQSTAISKKTVIICGWWYNEITVTMIPMQKNPMVTFETYIDSDKINRYIAEGNEIVYLPEQEIYNDQMYRMNITPKIAKPF
ncbi:MAG: hypothetical protein M3R27_04460 [Bacteroidota bacterium]|nr:hypothetical protein [Bacteroidota bacterium]